jgi:hypothetical protein
MKKKPPGISASDISRFHAGYVVNAATGCWEWQKNIQRGGYGHFKHESKARGVHRFAYVCFVGPIPPTMHVLHHCDVPACVNPKHLFVGTCMQNVQDKISKGRHAHGERVNTAKLSDEMVLEIYDLKDQGMGSPTIARLFEISTTAAWNAMTGRTWKHVYQKRYGTKDAT